MEGTEAAGTQLILDARERAEARDDWYVMVVGAKAFLGPVSEAQARQGVTDALEAGHRSAKLLRVVEDYEV